MEVRWRLPSARLDAPGGVRSRPCVVHLDEELILQFTLGTLGAVREAEVQAQEAASIAAVEAILGAPMPAGKPK